MSIVLTLSVAALSDVVANQEYVFYRLKTIEKIIKTDRKMLKWRSEFFNYVAKSNFCFDLTSIY